jgi:mannosyl-oligosaccharide glucosidase
MFSDPKFPRGAASIIICAIASLWAGIATASSPDASVLVGEIGRSSNESLLWGPYRPNLYFGLRPRIPKSLMTGLLWSKVEDFQSVQNSRFPAVPKLLLLTRTFVDFRHTCEQNEGMAGYGWDEYDIRTGGRQTIHDSGNGIDLTTELVKVPGGSNGGSWAVRIKGVPRPEAHANLKTTVVFYTTLEGIGQMSVAGKQDELGAEEDVVLQGVTPELGEFLVTITDGPESNAHPVKSHQSYDDKPSDRTFVHSLQLPDEALWQTKGQSII